MLAMRNLFSRSSLSLLSFNAPVLGSFLSTVLVNQPMVEQWSSLSLPRFILVEV